MVRTNSELLEYVNRLHHSKSDSCLTIQHYSPGQTVIGQQKSVFSVYIVKSGIARCYLTEDNGKDFVQEFFSAGEIFGEIEVINGGLSFCSVAAVNGLQVYQIGSEHFHLLLKTDSEFNRLVLKAVAGKVKYKAIRHAYNQSHTTEDNLLRLVDQFPELFRNISKPDIASYLGITLRSLNRTINDLTSRGLIGDDVR